MWLISVVLLTIIRFVNALCQYKLSLLFTIFSVFFLFYFFFCQQNYTPSACFNPNDTPECQSFWTKNKTKSSGMKWIWMRRNRRNGSIRLLVGLHVNIFNFGLKLLVLMPKIATHTHTQTRSFHFTHTHATDYCFKWHSFAHLIALRLSNASTCRFPTQFSRASFDSIRQLKIGCFFFVFVFFFLNFVWYKWISK